MEEDDEDQQQKKYAKGWATYLQSSRLCHQLQTGQATASAGSLQLLGGLKGQKPAKKDKAGSKADAG